MSISSKQKAAILAGILVVGGAAAFVYFDPLELDLLGMNPPKGVAKPAAKPKTNTAAQAKPAVQMSNAAKPPAPPASTAPAVGTQLARPAAPPVPVTKPMAAPNAENPVATPAQAATAQPVPTAKPAVPAPAAAQPAPVPAQPALAAPSEPAPVEAAKATTVSNRQTSSYPPPSVDLRHCLDLTDNEAIVKCANSGN